MLTLIANQLHELGYRGMNTRSLKPKHVETLVKHWFGQDLYIGTIKNRMAVIRWWSQKVDKQNVVSRSNEHYGIPIGVLSPTSPRRKRSLYPNWTRSATNTSA
jgi:hypothetical protein